MFDLRTVRHPSGAGRTLKMRPKHRVDKLVQSAWVIPVFRTMRSANLAELDAVIEVARRRGFRVAAAELGVSRTALSSAIAGLETRLGIRLFHRTTRSVSLTEAGERFVAEITPAVAQIRSAMRAAGTKLSTPSGTLRINSSQTALERIFEPIVLEYLRRYPSMNVDLVTDNRLIDIVDSGFDAGIRIAEAVPRDMISVPLGAPVRFSVVGSPKLFRDRPPPKKPADLTHYPCIGVREASGGLYRWEFSRRGKKISVDVRGPLTLDASRLMREAALAGVGLAYLNDWAVEADVKAKRLVRVLEDWSPLFGEVCLYYPGHRHVPAGLRAFVDVIRDVKRKRPR
jgi:DNA-binding transcriptional LysR family regulator